MTNLTPAAIDRMIPGSKLSDPRNPGLSIEANAAGRLIWRYHRRISGSSTSVRLKGGTFPAMTIPAARDWAAALNTKVEAGVDPREEKRAAERLASMTVGAAHIEYLKDSAIGKGSRSKRIPKPRTIADKREVYARDIAPTLGDKSIFAVTEDDLIALIEAKQATGALVRANRLMAEIKVFFAWCCSLNAKRRIGLKENPAARLHELSTPEKHRERKLTDEEIGWMLTALVPEAEVVRRAIVAALLTGTRLDNFRCARTRDIDPEGLWTITGEDHKNGDPHRVPLAPWGRAMMRATGEWVFEAERVKGPKVHGWYKVRDRLHARMVKLAGHDVAGWNPHDFRRTMRSRTRILKIDHLTSEAMLGHKLPAGVERIYDAYDPIADVEAGFRAWEHHVAKIAVDAGVGEALGLPLPTIQRPSE